MFALALCLLANPDPAAPAQARMIGPSDTTVEIVVAPRASLSLDPCHRGLAGEAALDGGPLVPTCRVTAPDAGDHWLAVASRDAAGLLSPIRFFRVRVDADPPEVTLATEPSAVPGPDGRRFVPPGARVRARARDAVAGVARLFVAAPEEGESALPDEHLADLPAQGEVTIRAWAVDRLGNRSAERQDRVTVDANAPRVEIRLVGARSDEGGRTVVGPQARATVEATDADSGVERWVGLLDGNETPEPSWAGPWPSGLHRLEAWAQDRVGNRGSLLPIEFIVDHTGPGIRWAIEGTPFTCGSGSAYPSRVTVTAQAIDSEAGVHALEWSPDGAEWRSAAASFEVTGESAHLRARDRVGNESATEARWTSDEEPPTLSLRAPDGRMLPPGATLSVVLNQEVALASEDRCGVAKLRTAIGDRAWEPAPSLIRFESIGKYRLRAEAVDFGGNRAIGEWTVAVRRRDR